MTRKLVPVAPATEIPEGEARVYEIGDVRIAVCHVGGSFYAVEDVCTHDDGPLGEGTLEGCEIECPRHGARFDVRTGAATRMPAAAPVATYPVKLENGQIFVELELE